MHLLVKYISKKLLFLNILYSLHMNGHIHFQHIFFASLFLASKVTSQCRLPFLWSFNIQIWKSFSPKIYAKCFSTELFCQGKWNSAVKVSLFRENNGVKYHPNIKKIMQRTKIERWMLWMKTIPWYAINSIAVLWFAKFNFLIIS